MTPTCINRQQKQIAWAISTDASIESQRHVRLRTQPPRSRRRPVMKGVPRRSFCDNSIVLHWLVHAMTSIVSSALYFSFSLTLQFCNFVAETQGMQCRHTIEPHDLLPSFSNLLWNFSQLLHSGRDASLPYYFYNFLSISSHNCYVCLQFSFRPLSSNCVPIRHFHLKHNLHVNNYGVKFPRKLSSFYGAAACSKRKTMSQDANRAPPCSRNGPFT